MNRSIKFRVWDVENKKMYSVGFPTWNGSIEARDGDYTHPTFFLSENGPEEQGVLMQYTGLKDKNGKEIYEGDYLDLDSWSEIQEVKFIEGAFCLSCAKEKNGFTSDIHYIQHAGIPQAVVIGNIYDNPDLIKGENL